MTKLLFIRGHNTNLTDSYDKYHNFLTFFESYNLHVTYINYTPHDDICEVYKSVCNMIRKNKYDYIVGHSMGGCLLMRYIFDHDVSKFKKIILLMPLVYKEPQIDLICNIPFIDKLQCPKPILYPENSLYDEGNILNDRDVWKQIPLGQIVDCYDKLLLSDSSIITTLNKNQNCWLFYATDERFATINNSVLLQITNTQIVTGKHECFNENANSHSFFKALRKRMF
jgi:hypothetical protein